MVDFKHKTKILKISNKVESFVKDHDKQSNGDWGVSFGRLKVELSVKTKHLKEALNQLYKQGKIKVNDVPFLDKVIFYNYKDETSNE
tara:strand:+ start:14920 stop:15180 length:261 start_codon:yes stop_codon:yes gene_type:complete